MKVGLVRHFRVKKSLPGKGFLAQSQIIQWFEEYDTCEIEYGEADTLGIEWKRCYASNLSRAAKTAESFFKGPITLMEQLREIRVYPVFKKNRRFPFLLWSLIIRIAFLTNHKSQLETQKLLRKRVKTVLDEILSKGEDVLIVSHAALMTFIRLELLKRGFKGPEFGTAANGKLYVFEN